MLDKFIKAKEKEIYGLKKLEEKGNFPKPYEKNRIKFSSVLKKRRGIIAEFKKGSPSMGIINPHVKVREVVEQYRKNGAIGVSIITEEKFFFSSVELLFELSGISVPILRKDFIFDPIQIKYTASTPASAILLIVKTFINLYNVTKKSSNKIKYPANMLLRLIDYTHLLGLEPIVEVFDEKELEIARQSGARLILVNNRDLTNLEVDLNVSRRMIKHKQKQEIWICASGLSKPDEVLEMIGLGFDGCLIGTSLMKQKDPGAALYRLTRNLRKLTHVGVIDYAHKSMRSN